MHYQFVPSTAFTVFCIFSVLTGKVTGLPHLPFEVETAENSPIHEETFLKSQTLTVGPLEMVRNPVIFIEDLTGTYHELTQGRKPAENFPAHQERVQESAAVKQKPSSPTGKPLQMVGKPVIFMQDHTGTYHEVTQGNRTVENLPAHKETVHESPSENEKSSFLGEDSFGMVGKPVIFIEDLTGTYHELTQGNKEGNYRNNSTG